MRTSEFASLSARTNADEHEPERERDEGDQARSDGLSRGLMARAGGGRSLPAELRTGMEASFGADFGGVRVHEDGAADAVGAEAFALGSDLHFARGQYDPASGSGRELIGHELAHVVQQGGQAPAAQARGVQLEGSPALEREADVAGARAARGQPARVTGTAEGVQLKGPFSKIFGSNNADRTFLDDARDQQAPDIAAKEIERMQSRLAAKAALRLNTAEDGALIERLDAEATGEVERLTDAGAGTDTQKEDVKALSATIARRSSAVKNAVGTRADALAGAVAGNAAYLTAFQDKAMAGFDGVKVHGKVLSKSLLLHQARAAARMGVRSIAEAQYQLAKAELDQKLADEAVTIEQSLADDSRANVSGRAQEAIARRAAVEPKVDTLASEAGTPWVSRLRTEVQSYMTNGLGARGAAWFRSQQLVDFRAEMKKAGRAQAGSDIDAELAGRTDVGAATGRFVRSDARIRAYDKAKGSVNTHLEQVAHQGTDTVMSGQHVEELITTAARQAAFSVYEKDGHMPAARSAAVAAAKARTDALRSGVMAAAKAYKDLIVKSGATNERQAAAAGVVTQVQTDEVGMRSVESSLSANSPEEGMSKLGHFFDFMVPERGDALKFKVKLEIPAGPGSIVIGFDGEAERGTRERLIERQGGQRTVKRDTSSLKISSELKVGYAGQLPGVKLEGTLGFFLRSDASSTDKCMKAMSYGIYRFLSGAIPALANLWGGNHSKARAMSDGDPDLEDDVYRSELWAAMVEEQVFNKDKDARVDIGVAANLGGEMNAGLVKGKAGFRGELMRSYDHAALKKGRRGVGGARQHNTLGDSTFDKAGARERRKNIGGRTAGKFVLESEVEANILNNALMFGLKLQYAPPGEFEMELSGGLKLSSADPADAQARMVAGIVSMSANALKSVTGMVRGGVEGERGVAGGLGNLAELLTRTATQVDGVANNTVGDALTKAYQIPTGDSDKVNDTVANTLGTNTGEVDKATKAGAVSETTFKVSIVIGAPFKFLIKIDEVQTKKAEVGLGTVGLGVEYEKSRRIAQIGVSNGKFHGELMGISTRT